MAQNGPAANQPQIPGIDYDPSTARVPGETTGGNSREPRPASYSMLEPRMKKLYGAFYKETYFSPNVRLDTITQELIALACSLVAKCEGCLDGHIRKALEAGATKEQISEAIVIAIGISAAAIVDQTDRSAARLGLNHFPVKKKKDG